MGTITLKCDMRNMLRQARAAIDPKRDHYGAADAGVEQLIEHIDQLHAGTATIDEFADFYLLQPKANADG